MAYFKEYLYMKASLICSFVILIHSPTKADTIKGTLPDISVVLQFLQNMIRPFITPMRSNSDQIPVYRTKEDNPVEKLIKDKVAELKPYLQDNDIPTKEESDSDDNITLDGKEETTIIEFIPDHALKKASLRGARDLKKDKLKTDVGKYKKIRKKIKAALMKEQVSQKTSSLITKTLDEMIAMIIENKCSWDESKNRSNSHTRYRVDRSIAIANQWNEEWAALREQYTKYTNAHSSKTFPGAKLYVFFEQFHEFLSHIVNDVESMAGQYKIVCKLIDQQSLEPNTPARDLRMGENKTAEVKKKHKCEHFKVCTDELTKFMTDFYYALNDTAVSTLKNYGSMYIRDVNTDDSQEKENIVTILNNISDLTEYKTSKIFRKETTYFQLDKNKVASENNKILKLYVRNIIDNVKAYIKSNLDTGLKPLRARLMATVKQDLNVNLDMDLGNLERDFKGRICTVFSVCNGEYAGRRYIDDGTSQLDRNSVYVKVQLDLDDELKEKMSRPNYGFMELFKNISYNMYNEMKHQKNKQKHYDKKQNKKPETEAMEYMKKSRSKIYKNSDTSSENYHNKYKNTKEVYLGLDSNEHTKKKKRHKKEYRATKAYRKQYDSKKDMKTFWIPRVTRTTLISTKGTVKSNTTTKHILKTTDRSVNTTTTKSAQSTTRLVKSTLP